MSKTLGGYVYVAESARPNGAVHIYTGMTRRSPYVRWGEHIRGAGGKYTSRGSYFKPLGAVWSSNPAKAERTVKKMTPAQKRAFGYAAARAYHSRQLAW
jgi:predicted GIY-YIG superfamily endonuclease